ncbi:prohibitin family protein [Portibacter lacus]|uniref:Band 7 domain-containing protein n=1 Tax=Portibacter lacus TaxID=1099794 RepID=A0AA37WI43_9BACT|nr:prohibitin family protein [Portibacter lacus]GLR19260.1 hypothetical protein GCM10007940_38760 [Portibacter lacus]
MTTRKTINLDPQRKGGLAKLLIPGFIILIIIMILSNTTFVTIDPGEKGIVFKRFSGGLDKEAAPLSQGFRVIMPWNKVYIYDIRMQEHFEKMTVLSKNGLNIEVELSCRYRPISAEIAYLHDEIGKDYLGTIILPELRSATREIIGKYLPDELYSTKRETIQLEIFERTKDKVEKNHLIIDDILIRGVKLPQTLQDAIERKLKEEQSSLEYEFRLTSERKEAERRLIEAQAKADANEILSKSLNEKILRDKGIEATLKLAESPNSKVVIVGGSDGLPLILNN